MSSPNSASTAPEPAETPRALDFRPRPSRLLGRYLMVVHGVAAVVVVTSISDRWLVAGLLGLIAFSYYRGYVRHMLQRGGKVARRIVCRDDGAWFLQDNGGALREARLLPSSYLHPKLVILNFALERRAGRRNLVLCPDSLDAQTLRRLRQYLRVTAQGQPDARFDRA